MNNEPIQVWIVDDDRSMRWVLAKALQQEDMQTQSYEQAERLLAQVAQQTPDVIVTDIRMPGMDGLELLQRIHEHHADLPVIVMTAHSDLDSAVASNQGGAFEYLPKPFDLFDAAALVRRAHRLTMPDPDLHVVHQTSGRILRQNGCLPALPVGRLPMLQGQLRPELYEHSSSLKPAIPIRVGRVYHHLSALATKPALRSSA